MEAAIRIHHVWENGELVRSYYETPTPEHEYFGRVDVYPRPGEQIVDTSDFFDAAPDTSETDTVIEDTVIEDTFIEDTSTSSETITFTPVCQNSAASRMLSDINIIKHIQEKADHTCHTAQIENLWRNRNRVMNTDCLQQVEPAYQSFLQDLYYNADCSKTRCGEQLIIQEHDRFELNDKWFTSTCKS